MIHCVGLGVPQVHCDGSSSAAVRWVATSVHAWPSGWSRERPVVEDLDMDGFCN